MATIKEIAEKAGVSTTTVSNVIHGKTKKVSPATIQKIEALIKEVGYVQKRGLRVLNNEKSQLIAVGLGMTGNILAPIVFLLLFNIPSLLVKYYGTFLGYKLGSEYIQKVYASGLMNILTKAASTVGLIMVGGMTASMVTFNSTFELSMQGESILNLQSMLDQIFIGIVPLGLTLLCYYLLKKKNVSITVLIIGVIVLGIVLSLLGIA